MVCKHRKIHLFDIDIPGQITFKESDTLSPGDQPTGVLVHCHNRSIPGNRKPCICNPRPETLNPGPQTLHMQP